MISFIKFIKKATIIGNEEEEIQQEAKKRKLAKPGYNESIEASKSGCSRVKSTIQRRGCQLN